MSKFSTNKFNLPVSDGDCSSSLIGIPKWTKEKLYGILVGNGCKLGPLSKYRKADLCLIAKRVVDRQTCAGNYTHFGKKF